MSSEEALGHLHDLIGPGPKTPTAASPQFQHVHEINRRYNPSGHSSYSQLVHRGSNPSDVGGAEAILKSPTRQPDQNSNHDEPYASNLNSYIAHTGGQPVLFSHNPGRSTDPSIESLSATPDARHLLPRVLGTAIHESIRRFGKPPVASTDLSASSAPFVTRLTGQPTEATNNEGAGYATRAAQVLADVHRNHTEHSYEAITQVPDEIAEKGSRIIRNQLRSMRPKKTGTTPSQPELPFQR
jgi:hypothetical protein